MSSVMEAQAPYPTPAHLCTVLASPRPPRQTSSPSTLPTLAWRCLAWLKHPAVGQLTRPLPMQTLLEPRASVWAAVGFVQACPAQIVAGKDLCPQVISSY